MGKRVALVLPNLTLGGAERQAVELAVRLPAHGWRPIVLAAENHGPLARRLGEAGIAVYDLDARFWMRKYDPRFWMNLARVIARMRRILLEQRIDIVQSFLFWQSAFAVPAARLSGVKGVITGRRNLGVYKDGRRHYQSIENILNVYTDAVVCNSRAVARDVVKRERVRRKRLRVIYNGIDPGRFAGADAEDVYTRYPKLKSAPLVLGTVGNMKRQKRHDLFLRVLAEVRREIPGAAGLLAGRDLGEEAGLRRLARELGIADAVVFAGGVDDPAPYYAAMDAFLLTSDWEGLPNVVLEAMATGVPVVARPAGGTSEIIRHGRNGFLLDSQDPASYVALLKRLYEDRGLYGNTARRARETVERRFSMEAMVRKYVDLYEELASQ